MRERVVDKYIKYFKYIKYIQFQYIKYFKALTFVPGKKEEQTTTRKEEVDGFTCDSFMWSSLTLHAY